MQTAAAKTGLSVLVMLFGWLRDGVAKLESKDYPRAVAAFSKVIEHEAADRDLRLRARAYRAVAYGLASDMDKARRDVGEALRGARSADERTWVFRRLADSGLDASSFLPQEELKRTLGAVQRLGEKRDSEGLKKRFSGDLLASFRTMELVASGQGRDLLKKHLPVFWGLATVDGVVGKGEDIGTARVLVDSDGRLSLLLGLVAAGDEWQVDSLLEAKKGSAFVDHPDVPKPVAQPEGMTDLERLFGAADQKAVARELATQSRIARAVLDYATRHGGRLPKELAEVARDPGGDAHIPEFFDRTTRKRIPRLYRYLETLEGLEQPGAILFLATPIKIPLLAAPAGEDEVRIVSYADGHTVKMPEQEFLRQAAAQGWRSAVARWTRLGEKVDALVAQLGDPSSRKRQEAYRELGKLGADAVPMLERYRKHPDPEVSMSVRELLGKAKSSSAAPRRGRPATIDWGGDDDDDDDDDD